jgi:hypothetical protein
MSFSEFTNNKNKGVLWGLLQEGGVFNNIPSSMFQNVKNIFEMSILSMKPDFDLFFDKNDEGDDNYDKKAAEIIINSNKSVIKKVIHEVNKIKAHNENIMKQAQAAQAAQAAQSAQMHVPLEQNIKQIGMIPASTKKPKIEEVYRADDIKKTRMSELEIRLKEKQAEMDNMLNNKKPEHIDFSDKALGINKESDLYDKKLAGDEMERLLAETLASRERELDKLNIDASSYSKNINSSVNSTNKAENDSDSARIPINKIITKRPRESKNVTFNEADNTKVEYENQENGNDEMIENNHSNEDNTMSFFSKLKLKPTGSTGYIPLDDIMNSQNDDDNNDSDNLQDHNFHSKINEKDGVKLRIQEMNEDFGETREMRETRETREMRVMREMREMQKYIMLEQKIQNIQNDMNEIKKNQELILSILEKKL